MSALILTYHAVEPGDGPLTISPELFAAQLDALVDAGATAMTIGGLVAAMREKRVPSRAIVLTFDDGYRSVAQRAAPLLAHRDMPATVFCVAGHLGGSSDWPSRRPSAPTGSLADAGELADLAAAGFEIGCHGATHAPLLGADAAFLSHEIVEAKIALETATGAEVRSFALPYGAGPSPEARTLLQVEYEAVCTVSIGRVRDEADPYALPRVDAHYLRRPALLRRAVAGSLDLYLRARAVAAQARRTVVSDFGEAPV